MIKGALAQWFWRNGRATLIVAAAGASAVAGCATSVQIPHPKYVDSRDQAGAVLVSTTMVAPWAEVQPTLSPAFAMNGTIAATLVLPTTETVSQQVLDATSVAAGVTGPMAPVTSTNSTVTNSLTNNLVTPSPSGGSTTTTTTTTTNSTAESNSAVSTTTQPANVIAAPATSLPSTLPALPTGTLGTDPVLRYKAAAYLNQEVQLLNDEVAEAAKRHCYVPYVVKLKLAFMPYWNPLGYSAHTQISFLPGDTSPDYPQLIDRLSGNTSPDHRPWERGCRDPGAVPEVVPFLVADDLQLASSSSALEEARQIALAASFMSNGFTVNGNGSNLFEALTAIQNNEMHSSLTVARTVDNGLYVLISPNNEATANPDLVGQTYDVAVLLLIPRYYFGTSSPAHPALLSLVSYTELRDARSGQVLDDRSADIYTGNIIHLLTPFIRESDLAQIRRMTTRQQVAMFAHLIGPMHTGDYTQFHLRLARAAYDHSPSVAADPGASDERVESAYQSGDECPEGAVLPKPGSSLGDEVAYELCVAPGYAQALWAVLSALDVDSPFKSTSFEAPLPQPINVPTQNVVITGDTGSTVTVVLGGINGASASNLAAMLNLTPKIAPALTSDPSSVATPSNPNPGHIPAPPAAHARPGVPSPTAPMTLAAVQQPAAKGPQITLAAQALALDPGAHTLTITFPSPSKAGVSALWDQDPASSNLAITQVNCRDESALCPDFTPVSLPVKLGPSGAGAQPPAAAAGFTLVDAGNTMLVDDTGSVSIPLTINAVSPGITVTLSVTGAAVASLAGPGGAIALSAQGYALPQAGVYTLGLSNVPPGAMVIVTATSTKPDPAGSGKPVTVGAATHTFVALAKPRIVIKGD